MAKDELNQDSEYRKYDNSAIQLISAWPKVLQILNREIPDPEVVEIFPTNYCNFACPHCRFQEEHGDESQHLDINTLERLLIELSERDVHAIELSGGGEPLVHPDVNRMFEKFAEHEFRVGMITNGYGFLDNTPLVDRVVQCSDWIRISVDGFSDETYKRVHGKRDISYGALRDAISELVTKAGETPKIGLKILVSKLNYEDAYLAVNEAREFGVDYLQFKFLGFPRHLVLGEHETEIVTGEIREQIAGVSGQELVAELVPAYKGETKHTQKCLMTFLHPVVDWDGEIYVCAFFEHRKKKHSLGNVHEGGFFAHWDSPHHLEVFDSIDPATCVPKCPMLRYNPVIDFIKSDNYRFRYI
ncbi:MAG: radical SAM protein [Nanoarchaeota archaeon]|nr:radical SAM protein [Nanoarchaeota archaeon]MBU1604912.1 radical SAM protein [Nanoarchaeota archaeon]MBU2443567.1 radical SAM protein [Nanoarchaeota archaeon]